MSSEKELLATSYLFGSNAPYVEELYESYLDNPGSIPEQWRNYFDQLQNQPAPGGTPQTRDQAHAPIVESFAQRAKANAFVAHVPEPDLSAATKPIPVQSLIAPYPSPAVRFADLDPLKRHGRQSIPDPDPALYGLTEADPDRACAATTTHFTKADSVTLRDP